MIHSGYFVSRFISIVVAASLHECVIHIVDCMYSKIASWRWIACLFETCRGCNQNKIFKKVHLVGFITQLITMQSQYNIKFISGSSFEPAVLFLPLAWWYSGLNCNWDTGMAVSSYVFWCSYGQFPITMAEAFYMQGRPIDRYDF